MNLEVCVAECPTTVSYTTSELIVNEQVVVSNEIHDELAFHLGRDRRGF